MALSMQSAGGGAMSMSTAAMAHQPIAARIQAPKAPPGAGAAPRGGVVLGGVDGVDKRLARLARSTKHLPLVSVDLAGCGAVAYHPPDVVADRSVVSLDKPMGSDLILAFGEDKPYKALRKYLTKGSDLKSVFDNHPIVHSTATINNNVNSNATTVVVPRPLSLLGARRTQELHPSLLTYFHHTTETNANAIDINNNASEVTLHNQALDGSSPKGDTYDRVCFHLPLHPEKKQLSLLPDEAVELLVQKAKFLSFTDMRNKTNNRSKTNLHNKKAPHEPTATVDLEEETFTGAPVAISVPGYASSDAALESWMEILSKEDAECASALLFPRSASVVAASLLSPNFLKITMEEVQRLVKDAQRKHLDVECGAHLDPLILTVGATVEGYEITFLQLSSPQLGTTNSAQDYPFGEYRYHHARCARFPSNVTDDKTRLALIAKELTLIYSDLAVTLPERKPCAILLYTSYDTNTSSNNLESMILQTLQRQAQPTPPIIQCPENSSAVGTVLLGAAACGRVGQSPIAITSVSTTAVGLRISYFGENEKGHTNSKLDSEVNVIFDFDICFPARPYALDFSATECAAARDSITSSGKVDDSLDLKKFEGKKGIPKREEAALNFNIQIVQRTDRTSEWVAVDDIIYPLRSTIEKDDEETKIACESARLEVRMRGEGILVSSLASDGVSVVQADKSARFSLLQYYGGWIFFILFFGGFLLKSYLEDFIFQRDTKRVLAYYKRAVPNSMHDGDENGARYLVYKYRHKKDKLWLRLQKKYGYPIPEDWTLFVKEVLEETTDNPISEGAPKEDASDLDMDETKPDSTESEEEL
mmetsp:Transcript_2748/g.4162  ORF Transcript_2748/g.4162 Transcript_2748/m.4162 type:complete len:820 (+) Transcript_2748:73-2532(+)